MKLKDKVGLPLRSDQVTPLIVGGWPIFTTVESDTGAGSPFWLSVQ